MGSKATHVDQLTPERKTTINCFNFTNIWSPTFLSNTTQKVCSGVIFLTSKRILYGLCTFLRIRLLSWGWASLVTSKACLKLMQATAMLTQLGSFNVRALLKNGCLAIYNPSFYRLKSNPEVSTNYSFGPLARLLWQQLMISFQQRAPALCLQDQKSPHGDHCLRKLSLSLMARTKLCCHCHLLKSFKVWLAALTIGLITSWSPNRRSGTTW